MGRFILFIVLILATVVLEGSCGSMVPEREAIRAAETMGFSNVRVVKRDIYFVSCRGGSEKDNVRFTVEGTNPAGKNVTLYVFAGWPFKAATIRTK
jgi:hypothetical protein